MSGVGDVTVQHNRFAEGDTASACEIIRQICRELLRGSLVAELTLGAAKMASRTNGRSRKRRKWQAGRRSQERRNLLKSSRLRFLLAIGGVGTEIAVEKLFYTSRLGGSHIVSFNLFC